MEAIFNWDQLRNIYIEDQKETEREIEFQEFAEKEVQVKFNLLKFRYDYLHLCPKEIKEFVKSLRINNK